MPVYPSLLTRHGRAVIKEIIRNQSRDNEGRRVKSNNLPKPMPKTQNQRSQTTNIETSPQCPQATKYSRTEKSPSLGLPKLCLLPEIRYRGGPDSLLQLEFAPTSKGVKAPGSKAPPRQKSKASSMPHAPHQLFRDEGLSRSSSQGRRQPTTPRHARPAWSKHSSRRNPKPPCRFGVSSGPVAQPLQSRASSARVVSPKLPHQLPWGLSLTSFSTPPSGHLQPQVSSNLQ